MDDKKLDMQKIINTINQYADTTLADIAAAIKGDDPNAKEHYCYNIDEQKNVLSDYLRELLIELIKDRKVFIGLSYPVKIVYPVTASEIRNCIETNPFSAIKFYTPETLVRDKIWLS